MNSYPDYEWNLTNFLLYFIIFRPSHGPYHRREVFSVVNKNKINTQDDSR